jgi:hypothetical protein
MLIEVNTQKILWQGEKRCLSSANHGRVLPLPELSSLRLPHEMKQLERPSLLRWGQQ